MAKSKKCRASGKIGYYSEIDALDKARRAGEFHNVKMRVYRCPKCKLFHTARKKYKNAKGR